MDVNEINIKIFYLNKITRSEKMSIFLVFKKTINIYIVQPH